MAPYIIDKIVSEAKSAGCEIGKFFIATNAKKYNHRFTMSVLELYNYCTQKSRCVLSVTLDQFHEKTSSKAISEYKKLSCYSSINEKKLIEKASVINRGNAKKNGIGFFEMNVPEYLFDVDITNGGRITVGERIYINALGDVVLDPDLSYEEQSNISVGNVLKTYLSEIIISKLYSGLNYQMGYIYKMTVDAEKGTIGDDSFTDTRYYGRFGKAMFAHSSIVHNLHMNPSPIKRDVSVKRDSFMAEKSETAEVVIAKSTLHYFNDNTATGDVTIQVERIKLEDHDG